MPRTALAIGLLLVAVAAAAQSPAFIDAANTFRQARDGEAGRIEPAIAAFETLAKAEHAQPLYVAYLGSAIGLKAPPRSARVFTVGVESSRPIQLHPNSGGTGSFQSTRPECRWPHNAEQKHKRRGQRQ